MRIQLLNLSKQFACHECDLIVDVPELGDAQKATCPRCGFVFTRYFLNARSKLFAFSTCSLIFMTLALIFPFLILTSRGNEKTVSFVQALQSMGSDTYLSVVIFMLVTTVIIPAVVLLGINYVLLSSKRTIELPYTKNILRLVFYLHPWNMTEIFLLGILISMVKITSLAHIQFGWSFFAFVFYILSMAMTRLFIDKYQIWSWLRHHQN